MQPNLSVVKSTFLVSIVWALLLTCAANANAGLLTEEEEKATAALIVGPTKNDDNCSSCHALETEAWENTRHFATFKEPAVESQ